jgi:transposase
LLPPLRPRTGRPARDHRTILDAILWVLRTGAPWRDLPERYGPWSTAWNRFRRWTAAGVWPRVLEALQRRRIATRYEKRAGHDLAMLTLVALVLWL